MEILKVWNRVDAFLAANAAKVHSSLGPPAPAEAIRALEAEIGSSLPIDVRASLACHDGQVWREVLFDNEYLLSAGGILEKWRLQNEIQEDLGGPLEGFWVPRMVPLTDSDGDGYCVDATSGSVWYFLHDQGLTRAPVDSSWAALLSRVSEAFERGAYERVAGGLFLRPPIEMNFG